MLVAVICMLLVVGFFWAAFRKPQLIPRGVQNVGEIASWPGVTRSCGPRLAGAATPTCPSCVAVLLHLDDEPDGAHPGLPVPCDVRIGFVWPLVAFVYLLYLYLGFKHQGFPATSRT